MYILKDTLVEQRFGRLVVLERAGSNKHRAALWRCLCDCGNEVITTGNGMRKGTTQSCGCLRLERATAANFKHGERHTICKEWQTFIPFRDWALANGYEEGLTIERIDVNGNYEPMYEGKCLAEWCRDLNLDYDMVYSRIRRGYYDRIRSRIV